MSLVKATRLVVTLLSLGMMVFSFSKRQGKGIGRMEEEIELCHCPRPENGLVQGYWDEKGSLICSRCNNHLVVNEEDEIYMCGRDYCDPSPEYPKESRVAAEIATNDKLFGNFLWICEHCGTYSWLKGEKHKSETLVKHLRYSVGMFCPNPKCGRLNLITKEWRVMLK